MTARKGRVIYGYKAHVTADEGTNLVRDVSFTLAALNDTLALPSLVQGDEAAAYADRAYDSAALAEAGVKNRFMHRARRNRPLRPWQRWHNRALSPIRSGIERIFWHLEAQLGDSADALPGARPQPGASAPPGRRLEPAPPRHRFTPPHGQSDHQSS